MNRSIADRTSIDADRNRRRADKPAGTTGWAAIPAVVAGIVNRILHREAQQPVPFQVARRRAGVYMWRQVLGPDGQPKGEAEIVPVPDSHKHRGSVH